MRSRTPVGGCYSTFPHLIVSLKQRCEKKRKTASITNERAADWASFVAEGSEHAADLLPVPERPADWLPIPRCPPPSITGYTGVELRDQRYRASCGRCYLGSYQTADEAAEVYDRAAIQSTSVPTCTHTHTHTYLCMHPHACMLTHVHTDAHTHVYTLPGSIARSARTAALMSTHRSAPMPVPAWHDPVGTHA